MAQVSGGATPVSVLTTYLIKKFIPALENELQYQKFTTKATIPQGMGNIARYNVFDSPAVNATAISPEGSTTDNELTVITTTATNLTLAEYGEFLAVSRLYDFTAVPGTRAELANRMSYGAARSLDRVVLNVIHNVATVAFWATSASNGGTTTAQANVANGSAATIIGASRQLRDQSALGFNGISGHPQRHYAVVVSPKFELDMVSEGTTDRMTWSEANTDVPGASGQAKWVNGYMGSVYGTACYRTQANINTTYTNTANNSYMLAEGGVASVSIIDADPQIYVNTASAGDVGNPYRNRSTIAWHAYFAAALIDGNRIVRIYSQAT